MRPQLLKVLLSRHMAPLVAALTLACTSTRPHVVDPCALLSATDIVAAQGASLVTAQATVHNSGGLTVSQCFFQLPNYADSVTVELTTPDDPRRPSPRSIWQSRFSERAERAAENDEEERERESGPGAPRRFIPIRGVGREAAWTGNRVSGALYVLTPWNVMRISVGGSGSAEEKIERSKRLALAALAKMESR